MAHHRRPCDLGGNKTFFHGIRVVGPGPPRPAGIGPAMSTPYQPTRDHDLENTSMTAQPPTPSTPLTVPDAEIQLRRPPQEVHQGYRPATPIHRFNNKSLNWPAWFRHFGRLLTSMGGARTRGRYNWYPTWTRVP